jgi:acetoin utilization protein AcuC
MRRAAFVYDESQSKHVLREDHVFRPNRLQLTYELLRAYGAFNDTAPAHPKTAGDSEILSFHTPDYVAAVKDLSSGVERSDAVSFNFSEHGDNPPYEGMYEVSALAVGASVTAARLVADGDADVAFNISGGLHHAAPGYASGFCVFNDAVIAIMSLLKRGLRVAYIDIDAHHSDGVQDAFYRSDQVMTISLHEWGRFLFPGSGMVSEIGEGPGKGYSVNVPLLPNTDDIAYLEAFRQAVPPLVDKFKPDIMVTQLGCDTHYLDPLTHLMLTTDGYTAVLKEISNLSPKWVAIGGGGYEMGVVPRMWALAYGVMAEREWPDDIPAAFGERYGLHQLRDKSMPAIGSALRQQARRFAEEVVAEIKRTIFPIHGL